MSEPMDLEVKGAQLIYTVGYEGRTVDDLVSILRSRDVAVLVDARYRAQSRKRGFSKTALAHTLAQKGIDYQHRRDLGTPPEMMRQRRVTGQYELLEYARYLDANSDAVERAADAPSGQIFAILCFERDPGLCHRSVVAARLADLTGARVEHLV